jgi:arylsulfatase A-like enzyme
MPLIALLKRLTVLIALSALTSQGCARRTLDFSGQNLLIITIDTLRADRLGAYGYRDGSTPNLDQLAADGVRFDSAYSPVPLTLPAHATMFTGRNPYATGVRINGMHFLEDEELTLAELFDSQGYATAAFVSAYVLIEKFGLAQGFDEFEDSLRTMDTLFRFYSETPADEVYERFSAWLDRDRTEPFFAWVHMYDPHQPFEPPAPYSERFADNLYDGEVAFVDVQIGRILRKLEEDGLTESTVIVVTSDHGEAFGEHTEIGHGLLTYSETLRVPLIVAAPGRLDGNIVVSDRVGLVDLTPTLSELFNLRLSPGHHGRSLVPLLGGFGDGDEPTLYFESLAGVYGKNWAARQGIIADGHKFIRLPQSELYDLDSDPGETRNLAREERAQAAAMEETLEQMLLAEPEKEDSRREMSGEDRRQLEALGYLSGSGASGTLIDPKQGIDIEMRTRTAKALVRAGRLDEGEAILSELLEEYPDAEVIDLYELRSEILAKRGNEEGAIAALEEGVAKLPESAVRIRLASYLHSIGRLDEAEHHANLILERDPRLSYAISLLGMIAEGRGELSTALEHFERALEMEPRSVPLQAKIADVRARQGDLQTALEIYNRLVADGSLDDDAEHLFKAAALFSLSNKPERAEDLFLRGLALEPAAQHYLALSIVQLSLGKTSEAVHSLETALGTYGEELDPQKVALAETLLQAARQGPPAGP